MAPRPKKAAPEVAVPAAAGRDLTGLLHHTIIELVRSDTRDLSARQLGVFLTSYLIEGDHTVRGLAATLNVTKPAITRAIDRLEYMELARRQVDPRDRRSVLVKQTAKGTAFLHNLRTIMGKAAAIKPA